MISPKRYPARRARLRRLLKLNKIPAILISDVTNVTYLTGFSGDSSWLLLTAEQELLISDGRFTVQIAEECPGLEAAIRPVTQTLIEAVQQALGSFRLTSCAFEAADLSFFQAENLQAGVPGTEFMGVIGWVEKLRAIKDDDEVQEIRRAILQAEKGFAFLRSALTPEMTEREVSFTLEEGMRKFGALGASFEIIAAVGPRAALPHARPGQSRVSESPFLLVDWGARAATGYISDLTRMIVTKKPPAKFEKMYEVVRQAQELAIAAIRPGISGKEIDRIARNSIEQAGFGPLFNHGLGHGIGLEVHESIRFSPSSVDILEAGMVMTVEPGLYIGGWGGIRLEDDVLVTKDGYEILSSWPKELESCPIIC